MERTVAFEKLCRCMLLVLDSRECIILCLWQGYPKSKSLTSLALELSSELFSRDLRVSSLINLPYVVCVAVVYH